MPYVYTQVESPPFSYDNHRNFHIFDKDHGRSYKRCESKELYNLLTYDAEAAKYTKAGKLRKNPPNHKDETQYFYCAQLLHYGLKPLKSKSAAKKALLVAFGDSKTELRVPEHILKLEKELEAQFRAKEAVLLEEKEKEKEKEREKKEIEYKKRKREDDALLAEVQEQASTAVGFGKKQKGRPQRLDINKISGTYVIAAPEVLDGWDLDGPLTLQLAPSATAGHIWGSFDFGVVEGKLRSCSSTNPTDNVVRFLWRGRETGEGESTYGPSNFANLKFLSNDTFKGRMYWDCLGDFDLVGKLDASSSSGEELTDEVSGWKDEYWSLNDSNYERERKGRWGGVGFDGGDNSEPDSNSDSE